MALVLVLAVASAAIGAAAAFLLQTSNDPPRQQPRSQSAQRPSRRPRKHSNPHPTSRPNPPTPPTSPPSQTCSSKTPNRPSRSRPSPRPQTNASHRAPNRIIQNRNLQQTEQESAQQQADSPQSQPAEQAQPEPRLITAITPDLLTQGEAVALTVESDEATAVAATIGTRSWTLFETEPQLWWTIIAIPRDAATGSTEIVIDLYGEGGAWLRSVTASIVVLASAAPFEEVVLGGTGITADPAEIQRDHDVRFVDHVSVTGPARWQGPWILPVEGEVTGVFGSKRSYDGVPSPGWHHGHDIAADQGDPIVAPAAGTIAWTGELAIHGNGVIIDHGAGVYSGYWHMSLIAVREGMDVAPGDWLGNIGTTGLSTGPHLHWEVIIQGIDVDPVQWLGDDQPPLPTLAADSEQSADTLS